jgi:hypothetical protein
MLRLPGHVHTRAKRRSPHRRFGKFFQFVQLDEGCVAQLIVQIVGLSCKQWYLALDFTNWKFGCRYINILVRGKLMQRSHMIIIHSS